MAGFTRRTATFKTPFLDLSKQSEGRLAALRVLGRHLEQPPAEFI
jgi:hypothetical protein